MLLKHSVTSKLQPRRSDPPFIISYAPVLSLTHSLITSSTTNRHAAYSPLTFKTRNESTKKTTSKQHPNHNQTSPSLLTTTRFNKPAR